MAALVKAIEQNRFKQARLLLELGDDINQQDVFHGITPLMMACFIENETKACRVGRWLLKHGANPGIQDKNGISSLMHACGLGQEKLVALFLTHAEDYDLNSSDNEGNTALVYSVLQGNKRITEAVVNALNKYKIDGIDKANKRGETPLIKASQLGHLKCVEVLLKTGRASPNARDFEYKLTAKEWETKFNESYKPERSNTWALGRGADKRNQYIAEERRPFTEGGRTSRHLFLTSEFLAKSPSLDHKKAIYIYKANKTNARQDERTLGDDSSLEVDDNCPELSEKENKIRFRFANQFGSQDYEPNSKHNNDTQRRAKLYPNEKQFLSKRKDDPLIDFGNSKSATTLGDEEHSKSVTELLQPLERPSQQCSYLKISKHTRKKGECRSKSAPQQGPKNLSMPLRYRGKTMSSRNSFRKGKSVGTAGGNGHSEPEAEIEVIEKGVTSRYGKLPERWLWSGVNQHQTTVCELSKLMEILGEQTSPSFRPPVKPLPRVWELSDSDIEENVSDNEKQLSRKRSMQLWQVSKASMAMVTLNRHSKLYSKNEFSSLKEQNYERFLKNQAQFNQMTAAGSQQGRPGRRMSETAILQMNPDLSESLSMYFRKQNRKISVSESTSSGSSRSSSRAGDAKNSQSARISGNSFRRKLIRQAKVSQSTSESPKASSRSSTDLNKSWSASVSIDGEKSLPVLKEEPQICSFPPIHNEE